YATERTPAAVWGVIVSADTPGRRLRAAWVNAAQRRVYGLPALAHDGRSLDADVIRAREADPRDADTRPLDHLAASAAVTAHRAGRRDDRHGGGTSGPVGDHASVAGRAAALPARRARTAGGAHVQRGGTAGHRDRVPA